MDKKLLKIATTLVILIVLISVSTILLISEKSKKEYYKTIAFPSEIGKGAFSCDTISRLRKYVPFYLTNDSIKNNLVLEQVRKKLNFIKDSKDTINGVDIVLDQTTAYKYFIQATDICGEKYPRIYAPCKNHIYALFVDTAALPMHPAIERGQHGCRL